MHKEKNEIQDIYSDDKYLGTDNAWSEKDKVETKKENKKSFYDAFNYVYYSKQ
jgi:hypothetical protein